MKSYTLFWISIGLTSVWALPSGAPRSSCTNGLVPNHNVEAQSTPCPYELTIEDKKAKPIKLKLHAKSGGKEKFKGFLIHALKDGNFSGTFEIPTASKDLVQHVKCSDQFPKAAVTHLNADHKTEVNILYRTEDGATIDNIKFPFAVVEKKVTFWVESGQ